MKWFSILVLASILAVSCAQEFPNDPPLINFNELPLFFNLYLEQHNLDVLEDTLLRVSNPDSGDYGKYLTRAEINKIIQPDMVPVDDLMNWVVTGTSNKTTCRFTGDLVTCVTKLGELEKLLHMWAEVMYDGRTGQWEIDNPRYTIPARFDPIIAFVQFVPIAHKPVDATDAAESDTRPRKSHSPRFVSPVSDNGAVGRQVILRLYNISEEYAYINNGSSVGVIEYGAGEGFSEANLLASEKLHGLSANNVSRAHIVGVDNRGEPDIESQLDIQFAAAVAARADLWYWGGKKWLYLWAVNFVAAPEVPSVISLSYGWNEAQQCMFGYCPNGSSVEYVHRVNVEFMKMGLRGVTVVVSSGDAGSPGRTNEMCSSERPPLNPVFPGSSPWILSVGATFVVKPAEYSNYTRWKATTPLCRETSCAMGTSEAAVTRAFKGLRWTSGAGFDNYTVRQGWQEPAVRAYQAQNVTFPAQQYWNRSGRAYPDVSALGHYCAIVVGRDNSTEFVDGTSCSAPLWAGILTLLNDHQTAQGKPRLGMVAPLLYKMYAGDRGTFQDITAGHSYCTEGKCCGRDYGFNAAPGWDVVSGLGTPNVGRMIEYLDNRT